MTTKELTKIDFSRADLSMRDKYNEMLWADGERGCEFSFSNVFCWGRQGIAFIDGNAVVFSQFDRKTVYPFPVGSKNKKAAIDAIIEDSRARGIPCRITGITEEYATLLEELYPAKFLFHGDEDSFDYVYAIDDLAELAGKKYHSKKNHVNRFKEAYDYTVERITKENAEEALALANAWFAERLADNPNADILMEKSAITKAIKNLDALSLDGIIIKVDGEGAALTLGNIFYSDTFDVQFEKALSKYERGYAIVNYEFARYLRDKYPNLKYLNREEDMGIEGLRRAKQSYRPVKMIRKWWAHLKADGFDY